MEHSGWLEKQSGGKKDGKLRVGNSLAKWDRRFFKLDAEGTLSYYKSQADRTPAGQLDCNGGAVEQDGLVLTIRTDSRALMLRAPTQQDVILWVCALAGFVDGGAAKGPPAGAMPVPLPAAPSVPNQRAALGLDGPRSKPAADAGNPFGGGGGGGGNPFGGGGGGGGDGGGGGGSGGGAPIDYGAGPFAASKYVAGLRTGELKDDAELESIEKEVRGHEEEMDAATKRMLRMAVEARDTGAATLNKCARARVASPTRPPLLLSLAPAPLLVVRHHALTR
jgi:hypothetical protein